MIKVTELKEVKMPKAIIIYDTRKGTTMLIAEALQEGMKQSGVEVQLKRINEVDVVELADYAGVILGSPTYNKEMMQTMKTFLFKLEQSNLKGKIGAAFGAYGWSGEAVEMISDTMKHIFGMDVVVPKDKLVGTANEFGQGQYREFGRKIAEKINGNGK
jgi:flavodoxin I